jgi:hypothetical protein
MADQCKHTAEELDEAECVAKATLKVIKEKKVKAQEEAEER